MTSPATSNPAIVTTLRNAGPSLDSFIAYHFDMGFTRLYLFFDDPNDPDIARMAGDQRITIVPHDAALKEAWAALPAYKEQGPHTDTEVMSRQALNAALAMNMARKDGHDWLLHIDADELFYSPEESAAEHFARLNEFDVDTLVYPNLEALMETEDAIDPFREVTLFKAPIKWVTANLTREQFLSAVEDVRQFRPKLYTFYNNGKSAVRLSSSDMEPSGVHAFARRDRNCLNGETQNQFILHYACCGFETFWRKYETLGAFSNQWWGNIDIEMKIGPFHTHARDIVASGDREAARAFYRARMVLDEEEKRERLLAAGITRRITGPAERLAKLMPRG